MLILAYVGINSMIACELRKTKEEIKAGPEARRLSSGDVIFVASCTLGEMCG